MKSPARQPPPSITIQLLGDFTVCYDGHPVTTINTPRLQALLAYLLLHRQAPQSRRYLAFLFWPDSTEAQALTNLRKQLLYLRQVLPDSDALLHMDRQRVQWNTTAPVKVDVEAFRSALAAVAHLPDSQAISGLRKTLTIYAGELLPGCYEEWLLPLREALHTQRNHALERLSSLLEEQRHYAEAIVYAQQLLRDDPLHEATYRRLIRLLALTGDRAAALRLYHTCVTQLREELGVDPDEETQAVYERLLQGRPAGSAQPELAAYAPFVGRQVEWQILQQRWRAALHGHPQFVLIAGEAGIGKTRLAEELLNWATHQGFCTVRARCYAAEGRLTYAPIIEWLRAEPLHGHRNKVAATWLTELARLLPELLTEQPAVPPPAPITQSWQRHQLFEAISRALLVGNQPLILLIDDLQWCDQETLALLHFLLRNTTTLSQSKLLVVGTARLPDEVEPTHPLYELLNPLRGSETFTQLALARLTETETGKLARQMIDHPLDDLTLQQLFRDTDGNPLFVVETMRATQGQLARNGLTDRAIVAPILPIAESEAIVQHLPPKVLAVIQARLGHLSATARELCEWAAIVGRAFTLELLVAASKLQQDKAVNALDELWQRRIIRELGGDTYDFSHDRIRDVAAAGISRVRRKYLHRSVAEALENEGQGQLDHIAAQIAAHYDTAGLVEKAIAYYVKAAARAAQIYTTSQTVTQLQRAIILLKTLPASKARDQRELSLLMALGPVLADITDFEVVLMRDVYARAHLLSKELGVSLHPSLLRVLAIHKSSQRDFVQAEEIGQQLLAMAQQQPTAVDPVVYFEGCYVLGITAFWQAHFAQAKAYLQQVVDSYGRVSQEQHLIDYGQDTDIYCRARLGFTLWYLGYPDQARQQCESALILAKELQHPFTHYLVSAYYALCACNYGDIASAETAAHVVTTYHSSTSARENNIFRFIGSWALVLAGRIDAGIQQLAEYTALHRKINPNGTGYPHVLALLAEAYRRVGDYEQGLVTIAEAEALLNGASNYWSAAEIYRINGELLCGQRKAFTAAEACFQQALKIARCQAARSLELRAAMSLAGLWAQQGKQREAHTLLAEIYGWFTEGFNTLDLQEAKALLARLQK